MTSDQMNAAFEHGCRLDTVDMEAYTLAFEDMMASHCAMNFFKTQATSEAEYEVYLKELNSRPSLLRFSARLIDDYGPSRAVMISHLYDELTEQNVAPTNTGQRYALALIKFRELTGAYIEEPHPFEELLNPLADLRGRVLKVVKPHPRESNATVLKSTTDGIYHLLEDTYLPRTQRTDEK